MAVLVRGWCRGPFFCSGVGDGERAEVHQFPGCITKRTEALLLAVGIEELVLTRLQANSQAGSSGTVPLKSWCDGRHWSWVNRLTHSH